MKARWKITWVLVALAAIWAVWVSSTPNRAQRELEATRRELRKQGFKLDLAEFNLATSPEVRRRMAMLGPTTWAQFTNQARPGPIRLNVPSMMAHAATNAALVVWKLEKLERYPAANADGWPELRETLGTNRTRLDAALQAALSGAIRFEPLIGPGPSPLRPHLAELKSLETAFAWRTLLALHDGQKEVAWTNLLTATCLATEYAPEPMEISHLVRFACAAIAWDTAWNAVQAGAWPAAQLADLQHRWESTDFWTGLAETAAFGRVSVAATFKFEREESLDSGAMLKGLLRYPRAAWPQFRDFWQRIHYRHQGSYEDEKAALLYYRDRELELRRAVPSATWAEMRQLPGVTNPVPFVSSNSSSTLLSLGWRRMGFRIPMSMSIPEQGQGWLGRAAEAEARRRLIIAAAGLERYRRRHGSYPEALHELVPDLLASLPTDFMDGQPLRYERAEDGHFVLYSVGLDCVDNGGEWRRRRGRGPFNEFGAFSGFTRGTDLVWPRPASGAEAERLREEEHKAEDERIVALEEAQAAAQWARTARRQAKVETILKARPRPMTNEPTWHGRGLAEVLHNENVSGTNRLALSDRLTLHQVITGSEPETVTFELPLSYDALTNLGALELYIDPSEEEDSDEGCNVGQVECARATNGNCLLVWSTIYECPGKHALQAGLALKSAAETDEEIIGPAAPFLVTNLCQFSLSSAHFQHEFGVTFRARLPERTGTYAIEIKSPAGDLLKTISGSTSNSFIKEHWDLTDDRGRVCTNDSFGTVLHVTLPSSGRSQTLRGP